MDGFLMAVGIFCVVAISAALASAGVAWFIHELNQSLWRREQLRKASKCRELGAELKQDARWFSESAEAYLALKIVGEKMTETGMVISDPPNTRELWRERCTAFKNGQKSDD